MLHRLQLILVSLLILGNSYAQQGIPLIHADSTVVDIRDGDSLISKQWVLFPNVRPDVYNTPNSPSAKFVSFITNKDSVQIKVEPGREYDLIVLLNEKDSCFIKISPFYGTGFLAPVKPASHSRSFALVIGIATLIVATIIAIPQKETTIRLLLIVGIIVSVFFWISLLLGGMLHQNYDHSRLAVSQLGAIGTNSEFFMALSIWFTGMAIVAAGIGLFRRSRKYHFSILPIIPLLVLGLSFCTLSFFPLGHPLHATVGSIGLVFFLSPILALVFWKNHLGKTALWISTISILFSLLIFLRFIPALDYNWGGLIQRSFHLAWTFWLLGICACFLRLANSQRVSVR
jgi:hypothetical membrane protein